MKKLANYIDGVDFAPISNHYINNFNPSTGDVYSLIPDSDERDVEMAYEAAEKAFETWSKSPSEKRFKISRVLSVDPSSIIMSSKSEKD